MTYRSILVNDSSPEWQYLYDIAKNDKDHELAGNYQNIKCVDYDQMIMILKDDKPIVFLGNYNNGRWPNNVSRMCTRTYTHPDYRKNTNSEVISTFLKATLDRYDEWGKDILFISRGIQYDNVEVSWKKFQQFGKYIPRIAGYTMTFDDKLYKCCPSDTKDCYQFCLWYDPKNIRHTLDIPYITMDEWKQLPITNC